MTGAEFVAKRLIKEGVTDAFGVPGGVILPLLYAFKELDGITPRLGYNEQASGFSAIGYAQSSGRVGVAYATRGPGVMNMLTAMAEAYHESVPVLFLTAHGHKAKNTGRRAEYDQEIDLISAVRGFTKYAVSVEKTDELFETLDRAIRISKEGRMGPVLIDIAYSVLTTPMEEVMEEQDLKTEPVPEELSLVESATKCFWDMLGSSEKPVVLIGDGIRQARACKEMMEVAEKVGIPVLSSRGAQDIISASDKYFGYIGSHGVRYANCILEKSDSVIALGNRLSFPFESKSYGGFFGERKLLHIDIDENELNRFKSEASFCLNVRFFLEKILCSEHSIPVFEEWLSDCRKIKKHFEKMDMPRVVTSIASILKKDHAFKAAVCDVGNTEFWVARAYEYIRPAVPLYVSKSFGTLGNGLGKAVGVYYALRQPVLLVTGDQGLQFSSNELMHVGKLRLPITIVVVNNLSSAMIRDAEIKKYGLVLHTTPGSGYGTPDLRSLAKAYGIEYISFGEGEETDIVGTDLAWSRPTLIELKISQDEELTPYLPVGNALNRQFPYVEDYKED